MLKQQLSQKLMQKLSPQQIQLMKLLQLPTATLEQRIKEELETNPALEESDTDDLGENGLSADDRMESEANASEEDSEDIALDDTFDFDEYITDFIEDDPSIYKLRGDGYAAEEEAKSFPVAVEKTFHDYLEEQMGMMNFQDEKEKIIALQIIGSIDDDGYLRRDPSAIVDDLIFSHNITASDEEVEAVLMKVQQFDPPGVASRDLQECLLLQLERKIQATRDKGQLQILNFAFEIIAKYFNEFTKKHYLKLARNLNVDDKQLKDIVDTILKLNPKPASAFSENPSSNVQYILPDFIIINNDGKLELTLNSKNAPDLRINSHYLEMLHTFRHNHPAKKNTRKDKEAILFIKQKIDSAKWFIDAIKQRQHTMYQTMYSILQYQYDYFLTGDQKKLKPMILKDIADMTGLDISTISRVANSKFVQTEFGTKRLKDFFSESLQTQDGDEVSTLEVKKILSEVMMDENKRKPLSDEKLKIILMKKGYNIARRTVAKYREQLNIPIARLRKQL